MNINNFWPDLSQDEKAPIETPLQVLKQQADYLQTAYNHKFTGVVATSSQDSGELITVSLYIVRNTEPSYNYRLLWFQQNIATIYPIEIQAFNNPVVKFAAVFNLSDFIGTIQSIFQDKKTINVLRHLMELKDED